MKKQKVCKNCGSSVLVKNRRLCKDCNKKRISETYYRLGKKRREKRLKTECKLCTSQYTKWRENQVICPSCSSQSKNTGFKSNQYKMVGNKCEHRVIAEQTIGRKLSTNEVVHHVDENIHNNELYNLWIMSRHHHVQLHGFLRLQRVVYEKSLGKNSVNCWNSLRVNQTTAWLEMTNAKVIKLIELANQQPSA
jgi:hypothetical protein